MKLRLLNPIATLIAIIAASFLLGSCNSKTQDFPEGNIDVAPEIYIIRVGDVDEGLLQEIVPKLETRFTTKVHVASDIQFPEPDYAYDNHLGQYVAMYIVSELLKSDKIKAEFPEDAKILAVTNVDLSVPESGLLYIFGQAQTGKNARLALISTIRMDPESYKGGKPNRKLLVQRMTKEAIHELGHVFDLQNCVERQCVMYLPKNVAELDKKSDSFCLHCQKAFRALQQVKPPAPETGK